MENFRLHVNGAPTSIDADPDTPLLAVLRDDLHLTGNKYGCGEGQCGACTVLLEGKAVPACTLRIGEIGSKPVETIEGLANHTDLRRVQQAFLNASAFQCGFCTPGMILASVALLRKNPHPSKAEIRSALEGNICRCGTYSRIIKAVERAAKETSNV